jgi:hypothetical protein
MTVDNMDNILRGWAKLVTAAGETAIQSNVTWGIANYTDATARQAVTKSLKLEVALYPTNKSLRSIMSALVFVFVLPSVKSVMVLCIRLDNKSTVQTFI